MACDLRDIRFFGMKGEESLLDMLASQLPEGHGFTVFPGFCDVHVHFREPGFSYKETILTGSMAAAPRSAQCPIWIRSRTVSST